MNEWSNKQNELVHDKVLYLVECLVVVSVISHTHVSMTSKQGSTRDISVSKQTYRSPLDTGIRPLDTGIRLQQRCERNLSPIF